MSKTSIQQFIPEFLKSYDAKSKDLAWEQYSAVFRKFWSERVMAPGANPISDNDCDDIIRILDRNGKGNTKESEAVARAMVAQGAWKRMFNGFRSDKSLVQLLDSILKENSPDKKASLIDDLYVKNAKNKNNLTGQSGNTVGVFLAAYDPFSNLSIISLNDRKALIDFLGLAVPFEWNTVTIGKRIVQSNLLLRNGILALGIGGSARTQSRFCYFEPVKRLWKKQHTIRAADFFEDMARAQPGTKDREADREVYPQVENRKVVVSHQLRERSGYLATERKNYDNYKCQVCGMRFRDVYGKLGDGFAEAHHTVPLSKLEGEVRTTIEDLRTVCANCHRMLHKMNGERGDMDKLRAIIAKQKRKHAR